LDVGHLTDGLKDSHQILDILFNGSHKYRRNICIEGCPQNGSPTPYLVKESKSFSILKDLCKLVDGGDEKEGRKRIPLAQAAPMQDWGVGHPVGEKSRGGDGVQGHDPIAEARRETTALKRVDNVLPPNGIKGLTDVKFEEEGRGFALVKPRRKVFKVQEVITDTSLLDECGLGIGNKIIHQRPKMNSKHLCGYLGNPKLMGR
jgi:hypothetical protein